MTIGTLMSRDICYHAYETASRRISGFKIFYECALIFARIPNLTSKAWLLVYLLVILLLDGGEITSK